MLLYFLFNFVILILLFIHFNHSEQQLKDTKLTTMELINTKREPISRARERFYIEKAQTMQPQGINREDNR